MMIQLQGLLSTITFLDVIDIVVVAYFLYRLFLMLKTPVLQHWARVSWC